MDNGNLRCGYTTGSAAAVAACAAYRCRISGEKPEQVRLTLPDGSLLSVPVSEVSENHAVVVKDGGDDPDVTTGAHIAVRLWNVEAFGRICGALRTRNSVLRGGRDRHGDARRAECAGRTLCHESERGA
ncbi:MAG: cobalt-precorrin-5B (C(1))-methyltransferase [Victivallales bacterium]